MVAYWIQVIEYVTKVVAIFLSLQKIDSHPLGLQLSTCTNFKVNHIFQLFPRFKNRMVIIICEKIGYSV